MELKIDKKWVDEAVQKAVEELKENNIWIPKGMTNGEVIQALFPYVKTEDSYVCTLIGTNLDKGYVPLQMEWWNAPYKAESEG